MRFRFIDQAKKEFPHTAFAMSCAVSQSGYFAWKERPASRRQCENMVMLAHALGIFSLK